MARPLHPHLPIPDPAVEQRWRTLRTFGTDAGQRGSCQHCGCGKDFQVWNSGPLRWVLRSNSAGEKNVCFLHGLWERPRPQHLEAVLFSSVPVVFYSVRAAENTELRVSSVRK